jgi:hypothetical protein
MAEKASRRSFLSKGLMGAVGVGAAYSLEERILLAAVEEGADQKPKAKPDIAPNSLPCGKIGNASISRLFLGGNLIANNSHSRDLLYVSELFKAYNTEAKIFETFEIAQSCGINTILLIPHCWNLLLKYNKGRTTKLQALCCTAILKDKVQMRDHIRWSVDNGAVALYPAGMETDEMMMAGQIDVLGQAVDLIKAEGLPAGVGSHSLETPIACEKNNLNPDFYVKTFHMDRYWSATPPENREEWCWYKSFGGDHDSYNDNMFCLDAEKTAALMATIDKPWVAFKVMAAGAIPPRMAFPHAYRHGADFIVAGMFDFQIENDVKIAIESLKKVGGRTRPWHG